MLHGKAVCCLAGRRSCQQGRSAILHSEGRDVGGQERLGHHVVGGLTVIPPAVTSPNAR
jgi:hypothetical protein